MLKLERVSGEKQFLLNENKGLEDEKNTLRQKCKELSDENVAIKEKWDHSSLNLGAVSDVSLH